MTLLEYLKTARSPTTAEAWREIKHFKDPGLPKSEAALDRELKRLHVAGKIEPKHNGFGQVEWSVVPAKAPVWQRGLW